MMRTPVVPYGIDAANSEELGPKPTAHHIRKANSSRSLATWLRRAFGSQQANGFLLMTPDGKLSREPDLLK